MTSPLINNSAHIERETLRRVSLPKNKYNFPLHNHVEALTGEPSDRTVYDVGEEPKLVKQHD